MPRLIDADELMEHVYRDKLDSRELIAEMVKNAPTVDAVPVKHGKWITDTDGILHCSNCANIPINRILFRGALVYEVDIKTLMKFCSKCGAKME